MAGGLTLSLHGVGLALAAEQAGFLHFARAYLAPLVDPARTPVRIRVQLRWDRSLPLPGDDLQPLGRRVWTAAGRLRWSELRPLPGLQVEVEWGAQGLDVRAAYRWPGRAARWLDHFSPSARARLHVSLIYYLVYFPWGWWMERERGWSLLHAAALADGDGDTGTSVVLSGLPGCGKSSFVWAALTLPGWRLLSDNLLWTDGRGVWACPEPLHLDARARELAGALPAGGRPAGRAFSHQREDFELAPERRTDAARPRGLAFLQRGDAGRVRRLEAGPALRRLWANDMLAYEWLAYQETAAALHHVVPEVGDPVHRWANLQGIAALPCYEITLPEGEPLAGQAGQASQALEKILWSRC